MNKKTLVYLVLLLSFVFTSCSQKEVSREKLDFTHDWKFYLGEKENASNYNFDDDAWRTLNLPHDWSIESDFSIDHPATPGGGALPGGIGWYRKEFMLSDVDKGKYIFIDFDGVYWNSQVWLNGELLGNRPNGYISFRYDLTPHLKYDEPNVISVRVDNSQQPNSRWYSGSGIYRNVWLVKVNPLHVEQWGTYVTTPEIDDNHAKVNVKTNIRNQHEIAQSATLYSILVDGDGKELTKIASEIKIAVKSNHEFEQELNVNNPKLWSIDNPYLYKVISRVEMDGEIVDEYETSIGIRNFSFDAENGFFLNGESIKIKGVCNHHDLGMLGAAVNTRAIERQLEILKEMGCNGIRTAHNPPAPELLDLCDKMGFVVVDEIFDMWRKKKSPHDYSQFFPEWHEKDIEDFILRDRNHPSIIMWSIGNEILEQWSHVDADTLDLQQANMILNFANTFDKENLNKDELHVNSLLTIKLADMTRKLDPSRLVTTGNNETSPSNHLLRSNSTDVIGFNYHQEDWLDFHEKFPNQKLYISESTSGLMSRGYYMMPSDTSFIWPISWDIPFDQPIHHCSSYDHCHVPWGSTHESTWDMVKKNDHIAGLFVWTGFDYLGEPTPFWWPSRSSYFGIIDLAGIPKDVYYMYQSEWTEKDVLHLFPHWNWKEGDVIDLWTYYNNADEAELFVNSKSMGKKGKKENEYHVSWRVPFESGKIEVVSYKNGTKVLSKEIRTAGMPATIKLTADRTVIDADGKDISFVTVEVLDKDGIAVPIADNLIRFSTNDGGKIVGTDNGDPTDPNSLKKSERKLFSGKAVVAVQSTTKRSTITVIASSLGLPDTHLKIVSR